MLVEFVLRVIKDYYDSLLYMGMNWNEVIEKIESVRNECVKLIGVELDEIVIVLLVFDVLVFVVLFLVVFRKKYVVYIEMDFLVVFYVW